MMRSGFDLRIPSIGFPDLLAGEKYKPNEKKEEFVGLKNPKMIWQTLTGVGDSVAGAGTSGLAKDRFDTTTRADAALIRLVNNSGSTKTIRGCVIRGKPVIRYSGDQGYIHDSLINYDDILDNGEKKYEFGNNYIASADHLKKLADLHWKNQKSKRHIYQVEITGRCHWYSPGEWYTLQVAAGAENINAVCECCDVQIEGNRDTAGRTVLTLREVYQNWTLNINAVARFTGYADLHRIFSHNKIKVASSTHTGTADVYCDGVDDQVEINEAIKTLAGAGGGTVELTEGTFRTTAPIVPANNIAIVGQGWNTIIEKDGNFVGIYLVGSAGNEYSNVFLSNFKITRAAGDNNAVQLIRFEYVDRVIIENLWAYNSKAECGFYFCDFLTITKSHFTNSGIAGLYIYADAGVKNNCKIINNVFAYNTTVGLGGSKLEYSLIACNIAVSNGYAGLYFSSSHYNSINGNMCENNGAGDIPHGGLILIGSDANTLTGNICNNNNSRGIWIYDAACDRNVVTGNRATANTVANFTDGGTGTTNSGNDFV